MRLIAAVLIILSSLPVSAQKSSEGQSKSKPPSREENLHFSFTEDNFYSVGNWASTNPQEKFSTPQEVEIDCFKSLRLCVAATAEFYMGHAHVSVQYLDIIKWDRNGIVAEDSSPVCLANTFLINFADHTITLNATLKELDDKTKSACAAFGAATSESSIFVVKGTDRWEKEHSFLPEK